jgi:hypothetical protein
VGADIIRGAGEAFVKGFLRLPAEQVLDLGWIAQEQFHLCVGGTNRGFVGFDAGPQTVTI